jgi:hypothetical protein
MKYGVVISGMCTLIFFACEAMENHFLPLLDPEHSVEEVKQWLAERPTYFKSDEVELTPFHYLIDRLEAYLDIKQLVAKMQEVAKAGANVNELQDMGMGPENKWQTPRDRINELRSKHERCPGCCICFRLDDINVELLKNNARSHEEVRLMELIEDDDICCIS